MAASLILDKTMKNPPKIGRFNGFEHISIGLRAFSTKTSTTWQRMAGPERKKGNTRTSVHHKDQN
jgi:hypothetical protein